MGLLLPAGGAGYLGSWRSCSLASRLFFQVRVVFARSVAGSLTACPVLGQGEVLDLQIQSSQVQILCGLGRGWSLRNPSGLLMLPPLDSFVGLVVCLPLGGLVSLPFWGGTSRSFLVGANGLPGRGRVSLLGDQGCGLLTPPHPRR